VPYPTDMAHDFPHATIHGVDIVSTFPTTAPSSISPKPGSAHAPPSNVHFHEQNVLHPDGLPFADGTFDLVYQRFMHSSYMYKDWDMVVGELVRVTKEGGWVEMFEFEYEHKRIGPRYKRLMDVCIAITKRAGIDTNIVHRLPTLLEAHGLTDIRTDYVSVPLCWGGKMGKMMYESSRSLLRTLRPHIAGPVIEGAKKNGELTEFKEREREGEVVDEEEIYERVLEEAYEECMRLETFLNFHWVCGRKGGMA
jgi:SAM-dependent methyltransferase